jgi:DNA-binding response OmpR family regulator
MARILVVEDMVDICDLLTDALREIGHTVDAETTFDKGEQALNDNAYDMVIADVRLPGGSGRVLAQRAIALGQRAVLITGYSNERDMHELSGVLLMRKPFAPSELVTLVKHHLGDK